MNELLQKLLESEILTPEAQEELRDTFNSQLEEATKAARNAATVEVTASLTEKFINDKEQLIEAIDTKVTDMFISEMDELKADFEGYRDLEAEYAQKLIEAKASMADEVQVDIAKLVDELDAFVEVQLSEEVSELREDIEINRQNQLGRKIFEAIKDEFHANYHDEDENADSIAELSLDLDSAISQLAEAENKIADFERTHKMNELLSPLNGSHYEMMETILKNVPTGRLDETYETFIGRVMHKTEEDSEKEEYITVLSEGAEVNDDELNDLYEDYSILTGDEDASEYNNAETELTESAKAEILSAKRLAGLA